MLALAIVLGIIVVFALLIGLGGFGGPAEPTVYRRIIHRRPPVRRVITEHRVVDPYVEEAVDPIDRAVYRP
ncbi:MAG: hypothetical protein QOC82_946 [Frankiaceae bacterium]|jgi:hypothetical protein|nr:hypothetical protein [Frankiaceae bacterium]